jgi:hypothetical protein
MKLWVSRQYDGRFMLTATEPVRERVRGTDHDDLYVPYGDPVGLKHLCNVVTLVWPVVGTLAPLQGTQVRLKRTSDCDASSN